MLRHSKLVVMLSPVLWLTALGAIASGNDDLVKAISLGKLPSETVQHVKVNIPNSGKTPFVVRNVKTSCACVAAGETRITIPPGETRELEFALDGHGRVGPFTQTAIVIPSTSEHSSLAFKFEGEFYRQRNPLQATPPDLNCGSIVKGSSLRRSIVLSRSAPSRLGDLGVHVTPDWIHVEKDVEGSTETHVRLVVTITPPENPLEFRGNIEVEAGPEDRVRVPVRGTVLPMVSVSPSRVFIHNALQETTLRFRRHDGGPTRLVSHTWESEGLDLVRVSDGAQNTIIVRTARKPAYSGAALGSLTLTLSDCQTRPSIAFVAGAAEDVGGSGVGLTVNTEVAKSATQETVDGLPWQDTSYLSPENPAHVGRDPYCGAYATWYAIKLAGRECSVNGMIKELEIDPAIGTPIRNVVDTLRRHGVPAHAVMLDPSVTSVLDRPFIAWIHPNRSNVGHFVYAHPVGDGRFAMFDGADKVRVHDLGLLRQKAHIDNRFWDGTAIIVGADKPAPYMWLATGILTCAVSLVTAWYIRASRWNRPGPASNVAKGKCDPNVIG